MRTRAFRERIPAAASSRPIFMCDLFAAWRRSDVLRLIVPMCVAVLLPVATGAAEPSQTGPQSREGEAPAEPQLRRADESTLAAQRELRPPVGAPSPGTPSAESLEFFEKSVRPLLATRCYECHGPKQQKGNLRLDHREFALQGGDSGPAIVAEQPDESLLVEAINYASYEMPPTGKLKPDEIAVLTKWVALGAPWPDEKVNAAETAGEFDLEARRQHWSFQLIASPTPPDVHDAHWPRDTLDLLILSKLEAGGLRPAGLADRRTLIRRAYFDLIGLPPPPEKVAAFLADSSSDAFEHVVDELLASPHFGERWGRHWLDLVRFAETLGHEFDYPLPYAWRYRDYVVRAFNADVPYGDFVREHIAGDLLNEPRRHATDGYNESIIGTGFWHLHEDVHAPVDVRLSEATRFENQIDVFGKTFLGLTIACARCHDHKFDPITDEDYYALAGFLKSSRRNKAALDPHGEIAKAAAKLAELRDAIDKQREEFVSAEPAPAQAPLRDGEVLFEDFNGDALDRWYSSGWAFESSPSKPVARDRSGRKRPAWSGVADSSRLAKALTGSLRSRNFTIEHNAVLIRVAGEKARIRLVVDGYQMDVFQPLLFAELTQTIDNSGDWKWLRIEGDLANYKGHRAYFELLDEDDGWLAVDEIRFTDAAGVPEEPSHALRAIPNPVPLSLGRGVRGEGTRLTRTEEAGALTGFVGAVQDKGQPLTNPSPPAPLPRERGASLLETAPTVSRSPTPTRPLPLSRDDLSRLEAQADAIAASIPQPIFVHAMHEGPGCDELLFIRGNHENTADPVPRRFLEALAGFDQPAIDPTRSGRLELAERLLADDNPLVGRVMANRVWQHLFGEGLVRSVDNFGLLGEAPTHPELLDHLAISMRNDGWSIKSLIRRIVLSRTYQMSSVPHADSASTIAEIDPANRLLHSQRVRRVEGEALRDAILAVSGELDPRMEGESVPVHLTEFMQGRGRPKESGPLDGDGRRSLYIKVQRNFLTPLLTAFDYPPPATTVGHRNVSNVPAQALILLNDSFVIEQAQHWARRALAVPDLATRERITRLYEAAFARTPTAEEVLTAVAFLEKSRPDESAWADLCHVLINGKEFVFVR